MLHGVNSGGDDLEQYHLCTDASKTGAGGVLFQLKLTNYAMRSIFRNLQQRSGEVHRRCFSKGSLFFDYDYAIHFEY